MTFSLSAFDPALMIAAVVDTLNSMADEVGTMLTIRPAGKARAVKHFNTVPVDLGGVVFDSLGIPSEWRVSDNGKAESADLEGIIQAFLFDIADKTNSRRGGTQGWSKARYKATPKVLGKWDISKSDIGFHVKRAYRTERFYDEEAGKNRERQVQVPGVFVVYSGNAEDMAKADS